MSNPSKDGRYEIINWADTCLYAQWQEGTWWIKTSIGYEKTYAKAWRKSPKSRWTVLKEEKL